MPLTGRLQLLHVNTVLTVGSLGVDAVNQADLKIDSAREQGATLVKVKGTFGATGKTVSEGPVVFGFDIGLSATAVTEAFQADPQLHEAVPAAEQANREVFPVGQVAFSNAGIANSATGQVSDAIWRDLRVPSWEIVEGRTMHFFACNRHPSASLTSGLIIRFTGVMITRWSTD